MNIVKSKLNLLNRELGALEFNRRVLALAQNLKIPLLERLKYICIVSSNLDEFFEIRIAVLKEQLRKNPKSKTIGIVMAGNLPLVGFHDFCCALLCGHRLRIKPSSKDQTLITHLARQLIAWAPSLEPAILFSTLLKGCDAYIATGSDQSSRYFEQYFSHYPHIIRKNRTGVALLEGQESTQELLLLADDVHLYFGLGCRNVTKLFVPEGYDFIPLLESFKKYL